MKMTASNAGFVEATDTLGECGCCRDRDPKRVVVHMDRCLINYWEEIISDIVPSVQFSGLVIGTYEMSR